MCTVVLQVDGRAVGLMSVSTEVDVDLLRSSYLLEPYHCLRREHPDDEVLSVQGTLNLTACFRVYMAVLSVKDTPQASTTKISTPHTSTPHSSTAHTSTPHSSTAHTSTPHSSTAHTSTPHSSAQTLCHDSVASVCESVAKADQVSQYTLDHASH